MGIVAGLLGLALLWLSRYIYQQRMQLLSDARRRVTWPTVDGHITASTFDTVEEETTNSDGTTDTSTSYVPRITYEYTAHGEVRTGTRVHVLEDLSYATRSGAAAVCERYPVGQAVRVHIGPTPEDGTFLDSTLKESSEKLVAILLSGFLGLFGLGLLLFGALLMGGGAD